MCEIPKGVPSGHSTMCPPNHSSDQHVYLEHLEEPQTDVLNTLDGHPIRNQFWEYPQLTIYWFKKPDELYQLLRSLV